MTDTDKTPDKEPAEVQNKSFKCANCGAKMQFKPGTDAQTCPYCDHENPIPKSEEDIKELDFHKFLAQMTEEQITQEELTVTCQDCGAQTSTDPNVVASDCPFCGGHIVSTASSAKKIKPKSLLPFKITRQQARKSFKKWITGLWFAPNCLKAMARQDSKLAGMYVPYWTYDSDTISFYRGQRGEHYWETQHYTTQENGKTVHKTRQVRRTRWYPAHGTVWGSFDDILVLASKSLPKKYTEKLEPWDLPELIPYKDDYLSGFKAESYQVDLEEGFKEAQKIMDTEIRTMIRRDIGGDEQRIDSVKTQHNNIKFKHILLPIWISAYRFKEQTYRFLVNARTGEVQGERPWSWVKITLLVISVLAAAGAIILAVQNSH